MSVTTNQVQRVMRASVWARRITSCVMALMVAGLAFVLFFVLTAPAGGNGKVTLGQYVFSTDALQSGHVKSWVILVLAIVAALALSFVYLLRSIFSNLSRGEIFCDPNVRHIRRLGMLLIASGIFQWLLPLATGVFFASFGQDDIPSRSPAYTFGGIGPFAYGALMILLSWIMAVGLGVREDAEKLRHDAELVI
jgi:hypothetical protein